VIVVVLALLMCGLLYFSVARGNDARAAAPPALLSELPPGAPTLAYIDLSAMRASSFYQRRPDKTAIAISNQDYVEFVQSTGFDFEKDLDRIAVASWPVADGKAPQKNVVIAEGRFDRAKFREYATRTGKVERQNGRDVLLFPTSDGKSTESVTFLDDRRVALVAGPSIAPLFAKDSGASAADPARERAARLDGAAAFVIMPVPPIPDPPASSPGAGAAGTQIRALARSVRWITLAARPEGDNLRVSLEGECDTSSSAVQLKSAMELLRMFGKAGLESPKATQSMTPETLAMAQSLLTSADITQSAERVRILFELTPDVFKLSEANKAK
jgi:hypothetical protein